MDLLLKILTFFLNFPGPLGGGARGGQGGSLPAPKSPMDLLTLTLRENVEVCSNISLYKFLDPPPTRMTGLVGFPGAGNHWALHLLRMATGIHTSTLYFEEKEHFPFVNVWNSSFLLIKDHMMDMNVLNLPFKINV